MDELYSIFFSVLVAAGTGLAVSYMLVPAFIAIAPQLGLVDKPGKRRVHSVITPTGGGIVLVIAMQFVFWVASYSPWFDLAQRINSEWWFWFTAASTVIAVVGMVDDRFNISPLTKLSGQIIAALILYVAGARVTVLFDFQLHFGLDVAATVLWFVIITNSFNLIDGIDGLASGLATIASLGVAGGLMPRHLYFEALLMFGFAGACAGFLRFNRAPAKVFLGDTGSNYIGFLFAAVLLETGSKSSGLAYLCIPLCALSIPVLDTMLAIWRRTAKKVAARISKTDSGAGVMSGDLEHLHHRLLQRGISDRDVTALLCLVNALLVLLGVLMVPYRESATVLLIIVLILGAYALFRILRVHELKITGFILSHFWGSSRQPLLSYIFFITLDSIALATALLLQIHVVHRNLSREFVLNEFYSMLIPWVFFALMLTIVIELSSDFRKIKRSILVTINLAYFGSLALFIASIITLLQTKRTSTVIVQIVLYSLFGFVFTSVTRIGMMFIEKILRPVTKKPDNLEKELSFYNRFLD